MHVWALGLSCETPAASGPPGPHTTTRELQTRTFTGSGASNTTKIPRQDTQRDTKRAKSWRERKKKNAILGSPPFGAPFFGGQSRFGQSRPPKFWPNSRLAKVGQICLAKVGLAKVGQICLAKVGLAKVGPSPFI